MSRTPPPQLSPADEPWWSLLARQAIVDVIRRRATAADRRDVALAASCYHPGAIEDHGGFVGPVEEYLAWSPISADGPRSAMWHMVGLPDVTVDGTAATAETYVFTVETVVDDGGVGRLDMQVGGRYLDRFELRDGEWRIAYRQLVWDWTRSEEATRRYWEVMGLDVAGLPQGVGGDGDPLYALVSRGPR